MNRANETAQLNPQIHMEEREHRLLQVAFRPSYMCYGMSWFIYMCMYTHQSTINIFKTLKK